jgi:hypothetical protein
MPVTFVITANPLLPTLHSAFGVLQDAPIFSVRANGGTASYDQFFNALRTAYPTNQTHPTYSNLTVVGHRCIDAASPNSLYRFAVDYAQTDSGSVPADTSSAADLLLLPPRVESLVPDFYQEPCEVDQYGKPIINSAGDQKSPAGITERSRIKVTISMWKPGFNGDLYKPLFGKLNKAPVVIPGIGLCGAREARVISIGPAAGFAACITIPATISGSANYGDFITGGSATGYFGTLTTIGTQSAFTLVNYSGGIHAGDTFTGGTSSFSAVVTSTLPITMVKIFTTIEWRETGFDTVDIDEGQRAWWQDLPSNAVSLAQIFNRGALCGPDIPLKEGVPSAAWASGGTDKTYTGGSPLGLWHVGSDALAARVTAGEVNRTTSGLIDLITFQRLLDTAFYPSLPIFQ